ncbi:hypothetical protein Rhe02_73750 [Rhizocola hellebori]|uniref:Transmembrane protein n=2 Tax=Rhizocola hellebori TaxID=1392758 RepID=A0A8J3QH38_9ACTN|nr:hypothetical protein Rhe02_73750 [Rhizocola hellebori]
MLSLVADARSAVADRLVTPWWYHPILGLLVAAYLVAYTFASTLWRALTVLAFLAAVALLARTYRAITGLWLWGTNAGRASRWAYAMGAVILIAMLASLLIATTTTLTWPTWGLAALTWATVIVLGRRFDAAVRAQLRAGA